MSVIAAAWLLAAAFAVPASAVQAVTRCPVGTKPMRTPDSREPWVCAVADERYREGVECPRGSRAVTVSDPLDPFKCALSDVRLTPPTGACPPGHHAVPTSAEDKDYECERIQAGFRTGPQCPRGYVPIPTPGQMKPFKCVAASPKVLEPVAEPDFAPATGTARTPKAVRCPAGTQRRYTEDPFAPVECVSKDSSAPKAPGAADYRRYRVVGELSFESPKTGWHLDDTWRDETASIYLRLDMQRDGRPITVTLSRHRRSEPGYVDMKTAAWREKEWRGAVEEGREEVSGRPALHVGVKDEAKTAFIRLEDGYLAVSYAAPSDLFERYLPVYLRILKSLRFEAP